MLTYDEKIELQAEMVQHTLKMVYTALKEVADKELHHLDKLQEALDAQDQIGRAIELFWQPPPDVHAFLHSPRYLGHIMQSVNSSGPREGERYMYPWVYDAMLKIFPDQTQPFFRSPYEIVVITGGRGVGKTTLALTGMLYDLATLMSLTSAQTFLGVSKNTNLSTCIYKHSINDIVAESKLDYIRDLLQSSEFFHFRTSPLNKDSRIVLDGGYDISAVRKMEDLGSRTVQALFDEADFFQDKSTLYGEIDLLRRRLVTKFSTHGRLPGRIWVVSRLRERSSNLPTLMEEWIEKSRHDPKVLHIELKTPDFCED